MTTQKFSLGDRMQKEFAAKIKTGEIGDNIDKKLEKTSAQMFTKHGITVDGLGL